MHLLHPLFSYTLCGSTICSHIVKPRRTASSTVSYISWARGTELEELPHNHREEGWSTLPEAQHSHSDSSRPPPGSLPPALTFPFWAINCYKEFTVPHDTKQILVLCSLRKLLLLFLIKAAFLSRVLKIKHKIKET